MIRISKVSKRLGATPILREVCLHVERGEFVALLGASGSGKTTLLRVVAGLERPDSGEVAIDGQPAMDMKPGKRRAGFVFQNYALFGHMTVAENIGFGLSVRRPRMARAEIASRVDALLTMVRLGGLGARLPSQLSGGQRQRVALARALAIEPRILLLDEPFGALDRVVREELREELRRLHVAFGITTLFVTHDQEEALALADRVVVMQSGAIAADLPRGAALEDAPQGRGEPMSLGLPSVAWG